MRSRRSPHAAIGLVLAGLVSACHHPNAAQRPLSGSSGAPAPSAELVAATASGEGSTLASLPAGPGRELVQGNCVTCHGVALIEQQHKDSTGWVRTLTQMRTWGAPVTVEQVPTLLAYLTAHYGSAGAAR